MKNAVILHGTGTHNNMFWFPYVKKALEAKGYNPWLPQMPNVDHPNLEEWLPFVLNGMKFSTETILIGHSAGAQLILSILEKIDVQVRQSILVSGYARPLRPTAQSEEEGHCDWDAIKSHCKQFVFINSDNDPWGCDDSQGKILLENLGGILVIPKGEGHMGSTTYDQPYIEFPLLVKLLDVEIS